MIDYNPKEWFTFIFRFHKTDTLRKLLPVMAGIVVYCTVIAYYELNYIKLAETIAELKNISILHSILGFVISLLLVFRTNTAYDRWWEGRKLWGALINNSRNLMMLLNSMVKDKEERSYFRNMIINYAYALKNHLRNTVVESEFVMQLNSTETLQYKRDEHIPNQLAQQLITRVMQLVEKKELSTEQVWLVNQNLQSFTDICGGCERIKKTPIPFSYSVFFKKFIFFYIMTMPLGYVFSLGYYAAPIIVFIFYVLASMELIAEEIEDPFGQDANDLPTDNICAAIKQSMYELEQV